mgnify:CR=1 FL=1
MEGNVKILLFAVLILLLALVAANFYGLTAYVSSGNDIDISISPEEIVCASYDRTKIVNLNVNSGVIGVDNKFSLYEVKNINGKEYWNRIGGATANLCDQSICRGEISKNFKVSCEDRKTGIYGFKFTRDNYNIEVKSLTFSLKHKTYG